VDHSGAARVKAVPLTGLAQAARSGVGFSPVIDAFTSVGGIDEESPLAVPDGDLRLVPDLDRLASLAEPEGWAWAPGDRFYQDGTVYPCCQRSFARAQVAAGLATGLSALMAFEIEWMVGEDSDDFQPAARGTGYGLSRLLDAAGYVRHVLDSLESAGVSVEQIHPEFGPGQFEVSVAPQDPVSAADTSLLVKMIISAVSAEHGLRASFAPAVLTQNVGNGGHLHLSFRQDGAPLLAGGPGRYGLTAAGESIMAGLLDQLPALLAIGAPTPASYLRLQPSRWAGVFQVWGRENREAALRLIEGGLAGPDAANLELKCFDGSANPYLLAGAVLAVALGAAGQGLSLPAEVSGDPGVAGHPQAGQAARLPESLDQSLAALTALDPEDSLRAALGEPLLSTFAASRRAELALTEGKSEAEIVDQYRWLL
jgi:glutamine synthetase